MKNILYDKNNKTIFAHLTWGGWSILHENSRILFWRTKDTIVLDKQYAIVFNRCPSGEFLGGLVIF